jgi:hypothetical protein
MYTASASSRPYCEQVDVDLERLDSLGMTIFSFCEKNDIRDPLPLLHDD